ncbi:MAG TPA: HEAT repeat domain-containing protein, partial [Elusimicrobiales bacterium]|nr:HEAT repeat domain-containing protein [Elusimicrobiales bacterium]
RAAAEPFKARIMLGDALDASRDPGYRCSVIDILGSATDEGVRKDLAASAAASDPGVRACAARQLGLRDNEHAVPLLVANIEAYLGGSGNKGAYEDNFRARLAALDAVWALGEITSPKVIGELERLFRSSDEVFKMNIAFGAGKQEPEKASSFLRSIAGSTGETEPVRAAAFEVLDRLGLAGGLSAAPSAVPSAISRADLLYTGGQTGNISGWFVDMLPIGHTGIYGGTRVEDGKLLPVIYDCVPNYFKPGGTRTVGWYDYTHHFKYPLYAVKTTRVPPTAAQRESIIRTALRLQGAEYSDSHLSQKGPDAFDCVGFSEFAYEEAGLNITPDEQESGWGWPLTPAEQYDAAVNVGARVPGVWAQQTPSGIIAPNPGIITDAFGALNAAFGSGSSVELPGVPAIPGF